MIKALVLDFDGVLTTNQVITREDGSEFVIGSKYDSYGLSQIQQEGIKVLVLTMEKNPVVDYRCRKLNINYIKGILNKAEILQIWLESVEIKASEIVYIGNDLNDRECLEMAGIGVVTNDCHPDVKCYADLTTKANGGMGAVREVCDLILNDGLKDYLSEEKQIQLGLGLFSDGHSN